MPTYAMQVNGRNSKVTIDDPSTPLLYVLQESFLLNGPKLGCGLAQCGSCTVLMDGRPIRSCTMPVSEVDGGLPLPEKALDALEHLGASRRDCLKTAGVMMIGFGVGAGTVDAQNPINPSGNVDNTQVDNWVAIGADESITVFAGKAELGTGMKTMQIQIAAEELSVPVERITIVLCRSGVTPNQGLTVGSNSAPTQFGNNGLRVALDTARDALYQLASRWLGAPDEQRVLEAGLLWATGA